MARTPFRFALGGLSIAALLAAAGCDSPGKAPSTDADPDLQSEVSAQAQRLDELLKNQQRGPEQSAAVLPEASPREVEPAPRPAPVKSAPVAAAEPPPAEQPTVVEPPANPILAKSVSDAAAGIAGDDRPLAEALRLALADSLGDSGAGASLRELELRLTEAQSAKLAAFRSVLAELTHDEDLAPDALASRLRERMAALEPCKGLTIPTAALCQRVDGFGKFTPFETRRFMAGRGHVVVVYVEVAGFGYKPAQVAGRAASFDIAPPVGEQQWAVELTQELRIYHQADGVLAWHVKEATSRDVSRRKRTDHYLVQRVTLPPSLTVGAYTMKVLLKDTSSGAVAEAQIPFEIVADASLTRAELR